MLAAGTTLGPYKILGPLGAGGMGEVYRAHDTRLGRNVAVKVVHGEATRDPERIKRFEQEARAAGALSHPNVCAVFDLGTHEGAPFVVMELLEGETLRSRLGSGAIPARKATEWAAQAARGLAAAHEKGIVHRDLKPENLFVTKDGRVKVLDFGLAKLTQPEALAVEGAATVSLLSTETGAILGTVGYMAPEQVQGERTDARTDLFALGAVLYELVTGRRAFRGATFVETGHAILNDEPEPLETSGRNLPPGLDPIVRRCLEKSPGERFQSAGDLAFALEALVGTGARGAVSPALGAGAPPRRGSWPFILAGLAVAVAVVSLLLLVSREQEIRGRAAAVNYQRITFRRGAVPGARFTPDGRSVIYSATLDGKPLELFQIEPGSVVPRPLGVPGALLLSISKAGMMALSLDSDVFTAMAVSRVGTLAESPVSGGAPHRLLEGVRAADWSPDGKTLAVVRRVGGQDEVQFPAGRTVYRTAGWATLLRIAPSGRWLAFMEHSNPPAFRGTAVIMDPRGKVVARSPQWLSFKGLAWSADGSEVWYSAPGPDLSYALRALSPDGRDRVVQRFPGMIALYDIARDGKVLLSRSEIHSGIRGRRAPADDEIELGWHDAPRASDISPDGRTLLFYEVGRGGGPLFSVYLRGTDGSPAARIGEGRAAGLSPDGKSVLTIQFGPPERLVILPVGLGDSTSLPRGTMERYVAAKWLPDGKGVVFCGSEAGSPMRTYVQTLEGGPPRPITPSGVDATCVSPDGRQVAGAQEGRLTVFPIAGGSPSVVADLLPGEGAVSWSPDGQAVYVDRSGVRLLVTRIDLATGKRTVWKTFSAPDPAGVWLQSLVLAQRSLGYAYNYVRTLDAAYVVEGLR